MTIKLTMLATAVLAALAIAPPSLARAGERGLLNLEVCNNSGRKASVAASFIEPGQTLWVVRGWFPVDSGNCISVGSTNNAKFYMYAISDGGEYEWGGDHTLCVQVQAAFTRYGAGTGGTCGEFDQLKGFRALEAAEPGRYAWTLDP